MKVLAPSHIGRSSSEILGAAGGVDMQLPLFPKRISTIYPHEVNGADIAFMCEVGEGGTYYCKDDRRLHPVRLTEWICTRLANDLGIATANCAIVQSENGDTYFGSRNHLSTAQDFELKNFLFRAQLDELGRPSEWLSLHLSRLYAFDLLVSNPDRDFTNFVLHRDAAGARVCAIDFASSDLVNLTNNRFPVAADRTILVGKQLRRLHGFSMESAAEMIDRMAAVPRSTIERFVNETPADWASMALRKGVCDAWSSPNFGARLSALRSGLVNGSLL